MATIIGEYRFVFIDDRETNPNQSLSSTTEDMTKTQDRDKQSPKPTNKDDKGKQFAAGAAAFVGVSTTAIKTYQTIRNNVYTRQTTAALIGGNTMIARNLDAKKRKQDSILNAGTSVISGAAQGMGVGSAFGPWGAAIGAIVGASISIATQAFGAVIKNREEMLRFMASIADQEYSGYLESRRLVDLTGRMR